MTILEKRCLSCGAGLEEGTLACDYCGTAHVVTARGLGCACSSCGAGNSPDAKACIQCSAALGSPCPECTTFNPLGGRFCQECRIEFRSYRTASLRLVPCQLPPGEVETCLIEWLDSRWFKARDLSKHLKILEKTLVWVPRWTFTTTARGSVHGKASQTHYRTESVPHMDPDGKWTQKVSSVPYTVWEHVSKEFDEALATSSAGSRDCNAFNAFLGGHVGASEPLEGEVGGADHERVFEPDLDQRAAFPVLREKALAQLRGKLLEQIEKLEVHLFGPKLGLVFSPVWQVVYRYKRTHGDALIHGATRRIEGKKISLLSQWFS